MTLSLNNSNKDFDFVCWVIKTPWLIYFRSVKFHYVKETHVMLVALVNIVVTSQHKRQRKKSLSRFVDNWKHRLGLETVLKASGTRCTMQMSYSYASDLPFKNVCKLAKQPATWQHPREKPRHVRGYMPQFVLKIEKLSHIIGPHGSQDLRSPSPIMAPASTEFEIVIRANAVEK